MNHLFGIRLAVCDDATIGKPDVGNLQVRFDEGVVGANPTALLYCSKCFKKKNKIE